MGFETGAADDGVAGAFCFGTGFADGPRFAGTDRVFADFSPSAGRGADIVLESLRVVALLLFRIVGEGDDLPALSKAASSLIRFNAAASRSNAAPAVDAPSLICPLRLRLLCREVELKEELDAVDAEDMEDIELLAVAEEADDRLLRPTDNADEAPARVGEGKPAVWSERLTGGCCSEVLASFASSSDCPLDQYTRPEGS